MRRLRTLVLAVALLVCSAVPSFADVTVFVGTANAPSSRQTRGYAVGVGLLVVGFEFEYANIVEDLAEGAPAVRTGMTNVLLQTPSSGFQVYITSGVGLYRETLGERRETHYGFNSGGGVKVSLLGPVRVRLDYRVLKLRGNPVHSVVHRVYGGLNLTF